MAVCVPYLLRMIRMPGLRHGAKAGERRYLLRMIGKSS
jgi:hypothetical protein